MGRPPARLSAAEAAPAASTAGGRPPSRRPPPARPSLRIENSVSCLIPEQSGLRSLSPALPCSWWFDMIPSRARNPPPVISACERGRGRPPVSLEPLTRVLFCENMFTEKHLLCALPLVYLKQVTSRPCPWSTSPRLSIFGAVVRAPRILRAPWLPGRRVLEAGGLPWGLVAFFWARRWFWPRKPVARGWEEEGPPGAG